MRRLAIALVLLILTVPIAAWGATVKPDGSGDYTNIQEALDALEDGDAILLTEGIFTGPGNWDLDPGGKHFHFYGLPADPELVVIDLEDPSGRSAHRAIILDTSGEEGTRFENITFRGGRAPGAAGGVAILMVPWVDFINCIFEDNQADLGGVFHIQGATIYSKDCHYHLNFADQGGVAYLEESAFFGDLGYFNLFTNNHANSRGGVFACSESASGSLGLRGGSVFWQNSATLTGGVAYTNGTVWAYLEHVTAVENFAPIGSAFHLNYAFDLEHSIIAWGNSAPVQGTGVTSGAMCNNIFGNTGGDWLGPITGYLGTDGNISEDPEFCGLSDGYFALQSDSPCAPDHSSCPGELIGALPVECGEQTTTVMQWDALKTLY